MKRKYHLTKSTNFKRVRRLGKSYAHPFVVLIKHPNDLVSSRMGIIAGRGVGNAVQRNRCKRQIREILRLFLPAIQSGWDIILMVRRPMVDATYLEILKAIQNLFEDANLLNDLNVD